MTTPRKALLASVAAIALIGGASVASAQTPSQNKAGGTQSMQSKASQPQAKEPMKMNQAPAAGQKTGQNTTAEKPKQQSAEMNKSNNEAAGNKHAAQTNERQGARQGATARSKETTGRRTAEHAGTNHKNRTAEMRNGNRGQAAEERNGRRMANEHGKSAEHRQGMRQAQGRQQDRGMKGLQGNASGMKVQLNDQQRSHIRDTVINAHGAPRVGNVNFDVTVGTMVPRDRIHVIPVPETLVQIEPRWRGLRYFVYEDEVVIVDPRDMRIVAVVTV